MPTHREVLDAMLAVECVRTEDGNGVRSFNISGHCTSYEIKARSLGDGEYEIVSLAVNGVLKFTPETDRSRQEEVDTIKRLVGLHGSNKMNVVRGVRTYMRDTYGSDPGLYAVADAINDVVPGYIPRGKR